MIVAQNMHELCEIWMIPYLKKCDLHLKKIYNNATFIHSSIMSDSMGHILSSQDPRYGGFWICKRYLISGYHLLLDDIQLEKSITGSMPFSN